MVWDPEGLHSYSLMNLLDHCSHLLRPCLTLGWWQPRRGPAQSWHQNPGTLSSVQTLLSPSVAIFCQQMKTYLFCLHSLSNSSFVQNVVMVGWLMVLYIYFTSGFNEVILLCKFVSCFDGPYESRKVGYKISKLIKEM